MGTDFDTKVIENDVVCMTLKGVADENNIAALEEWAKKAALIIKDTHQKTGKKVRSLVDLKDLGSDYDIGVIKIISSLMKENQPYIEKTATFGANFVIKLLEETIITMAGRDNIKVFKNKEDAMKWLGQ